MQESCRDDRPILPATVPWANPEDRPPARRTAAGAQQAAAGPERRATTGRLSRPFRASVGSCAKRRSPPAARHAARSSRVRRRLPGLHSVGRPPHRGAIAAPV